LSHVDQNGSEGGREPAWQMALFASLHPARVAVIEAHLWIAEPLSAKLLSKVFDGELRLNNLAYHVRVLAQAGVLHSVATVPRRGALEHFYVLAA
jgi:hypothetical protein